MANSFNVPSPRWYRITQKVWGLTENTAISVWLATGHLADALPMLLFKIASSYLKQILDMIMTNGTEYAPAGTSDALVKLVEGADTAKQAVAIVNNNVIPAPKPETTETSNPK